ncbi:MAG: hypothetical protein DCC71_06795 [Proteobacteria bacterium]|nr:MAG: hypothetical protein DCC71_06795 [Pseudomonadota bacterium]
MLAKGAWVEAIMWAAYRSDLVLAVGILKKHGMPENDEELMDMMLCADQMCALNLWPPPCDQSSSQPRWADGFRVLSGLLDKWKSIHAVHGGEALYQLIEDFERSGSSLHNAAAVTARDLADAPPDATWEQVFELLANPRSAARMAPVVERDFRDVARSSAVCVAIFALQESDTRRAVDVWRILGGPEPEPGFGDVLLKLLIGIRPVDQVVEFARRLLAERLPRKARSRLGLAAGATVLDGCRAVAERARTERSQSS